VGGVVAASVAPGLALLGAIGAGIVVALVYRPSAPDRAVHSSPPPPPAPLRDDSVHLDHARRFVEEAFAEGAIDAKTRQELVGFIAFRREAVAARLPGPPAAGTLGPEAPPSFPAPAAAVPGGAVVRPAERLGREPLRRTIGAEERIGRLREAVASDVAVHGLAYVGVLLLFAGSFGFILFSFGSLGVELRPVAEFAMPTVLLGSAWFLRRRRAPFVATALGILGGVLLPVVLFASFVDGVAFPPELHGTALATTLVVTALALGVAYALYTIGHPDASLRYLVVPMVWIAFWALGLLIAPATETTDLQRWSAGQLATVSVGVALTLAIAWLRPGWRFAREAEVAAPLGVLVTYALTILFAGAEGWPPGPVAVAGLSAIASVELLGSRIGGRDVAVVLQTGLVLVTSSALLDPVGVPWTGAGLTLASLSLLEWAHAREAGPVGEAAAGAGALVGLVLAATGVGWIARSLDLVAPHVDPWAALVAFGAASAWSHVRLLTALPEWERRAVVLVAAIVPIGAAAALLDAWPDDAALLAIGVALIGLVAVQRARRQDHALYVWWLPAAALAVDLGAWVTAAGWGDIPNATWVLAVSALSASVVLAAARWPVAAAVWSSAAAFVWTAELARRAGGLEPSTRGVAIAIAGLLAMAIATWWPRQKAARQASAVAVVLSGWALGLVEGGGARLLAVGGWTADWALVVAGHELRGSPLIELAVGIAQPARRDRARVRLAAASAVVLGASLPFLVAGLGREVGILAEHRSWTGVAMSLVAVGYAGAARLLVRRRPLAPVAAVSAFALSAVGVSIAAPDPWPTILALTAPILITLVVGGELRRPVMSWVAWAASAVLALMFAERAGVSGSTLAVVIAAWGAALCAGGLALDDRVRGRRWAGEGIRTGWLVPPVVLGAAAVPAGLAFLFDGPIRTSAVWSLGAAGFYALIALLLRAGAVTSASYALLTFALAVLVPVDAYDRPWTFAPWALALLAVARLLPAVGRDVRDPWLRWDVAPLVVAHGAAFVALARAVELEMVPATWVAFGALSAALALARRNVAWALGGAVLVTVGAGAAGRGWLALALAVDALVTSILAARTAGDLRSPGQYASVVLGAGAWSQLLVWRPWGLEVEAWSTATVAAALVLAAAAAVRTGVLSSDWLASVTTGSLAGFVWLTSLAASGRIDAREAAAVFAIGFGAFAVSTGMLATPLRIGGLREVAALLAAASVASTAAAADVGVGPAVAGSVSLGLVAMLGALALWRARPNAAWLRAFGTFSATATVGALGLALSAWPRPDLLEAVLLVAGVQCAALGVVIRRPEPFAASPVLLCAAWLLFASHALAGEAQWFTVPIGLATLAVVAAMREVRRVARGMPVTPEIVVLDLLGMAFVVGASLVEIVAVSPVRGLFAIGFGVAIGAWGTYTRVRRRLGFGSATVVLAVALMLAGPIARIAPTIRGAAIWIALVLAGVVVIAMATGLERGKARVAAAVRRAEELTRGWE
jgi:hypothetical protein